ncbi:MAG: class I SAM-dependent methyltransferase [Rhodobacteraceae bacterium]|nr:class I SAM-dependent methyltransferase [Paracoccaceae bacterium]
MPAMSPAPEKLHAAYALNGPEDSRRLYAEWAATYDEDFAQATGYRLPEAVAAAYAAAGGAGPVLDLGAGTGLVGECLAARGIGPVDGLDISPEMLGQARGKGVYRRLILGDVTAGPTLPEGSYAGIVSAGTFTLGHLGPDVLPEIVGIARPGALFALSVNAAHHAAAGFAAALAALGGRIRDLVEEEVPIYAGAGVHAADRAFILRFRRV